MTRMVMVALALAAASVHGVPAAAVASASQAGGPNLLVNGSFETGNFNGWTASGDTSFTFVSSQFASGGPTDGQFHAVFGSVDDIGSYSQTIATDIGRTYRLSFDLAYLSGGAPNSFSVLWNGTTVYSRTDSVFFDYQSFGFDVLSQATTANVSFRFYSLDSFWLLDRVSVTDPSVAPIPEPATWAMMLLGFGIVGSSVRRRSAGLARITG